MYENPGGRGHGSHLPPAADAYGSKGQVENCPERGFCTNLGYSEDRLWLALATQKIGKKVT